jgi:hypothetical protein
VGGRDRDRDAVHRGRRVRQEPRLHA